MVWKRLSRALNSAPERKTALRELVALRSLNAAFSGRPDYAQMTAKGYARNAIAFRCVRLVAEAAASIPLQLRRVGPLGASTAQDTDPLRTLLAQPNPDQSLAETLEQFYGHLQIAGNAYLELVDLDGTPREIYPLRPDRMRVAEGKRGWPVGWEYKAHPDAPPKRYGRDPLTGRSNLLHLRVFNPGDDHYGLAPMEAAHTALETHNAASAWNRALLDNAARPSGALVFRGETGTDRLSDDQYDRLKSELTEAHSGTGAAGRPLVLEGGLDWKPFGLSPAEMDFAEAKNIAAREIALAFGVPPMLLAIPGDNTYANYKEANLAFWRLTILPLARKTAAAMTRWLQPWLGSDIEIVCDVDALPALVEERASYWNALSSAEFLSDAERRLMAGLPEQSLPDAQEGQAKAGADGDRP